MDIFIIDVVQSLYIDIQIYKYWILLAILIFIFVSVFSHHKTAWLSKLLYLTNLLYLDLRAYISENSLRCYFTVSLVLGYTLIMGAKSNQCILKSLEIIPLSEILPHLHITFVSFCSNF